MITLLWVLLTSQNSFANRDWPVPDCSAPLRKVYGANRYPSSSGAFWENLHHALSARRLKEVVEASDLPNPERDFARSLDQDTLFRSKPVRPYILGAMELVVDLLQRGVQSYERRTAISGAGTTYDSVGYRIVHPDQSISYLIVYFNAEGVLHNLFFISEQPGQLVSLDIVRGRYVEGVRSRWSGEQGEREWVSCFPR